MELFGGLPLPLSLALLALIDGLSVGTLLIPVFLLLHPGRVRPGRILLYLVTIAAFYLAVGLLFLWGLVNLVDVASDFLASPTGLVVRLLVGAALLITAFVMPTGDKQSKGASDAAGTPSVARCAPGLSMDGDARARHPCAGDADTTSALPCRRPGRSDGGSPPRPHHTLA